MASDGRPIPISATSLVHGSQAPTTITVRPSGNPLPPGGHGAAAPGAAALVAKAAPGQPAATGASLAAKIGLLNKYLNDTGRPDQFRVAPNSDEKVIQEVNPATGEVIAEYSASEFAALARSVGISGAVVNRRA